jgi:hypothetical protein
MKKVNLKIIGATPAQVQDLVAGNFAPRHVHVLEHEGEKGVFHYTRESEIYCEATNTICIDGNAIIAKYVHELDATVGDLKLVVIRWAGYRQDNYHSRYHSGIKDSRNVSYTCCSNRSCCQTYE